MIETSDIFDLDKFFIKLPTSYGNTTIAFLVTRFVILIFGYLLERPGKGTKSFGQYGVNALK